MPAQLHEGSWGQQAKRARIGPVSPLGEPGGASPGWAGNGSGGFPGEPACCYAPQPTSLPLPSGVLLGGGPHGGAPGGCLPGGSYPGVMQSFGFPQHQQQPQQQQQYCGSPGGAFGGPYPGAVPAAGPAHPIFAGGPGLPAGSYPGPHLSGGGYQTPPGWPPHPQQQLAVPGQAVEGGLGYDPGSVPGFDPGYGQGESTAPSGWRPEWAALGFHAAGHPSQHYHQ